MSSFAPGGGHLDATAGREVVFCHACQNEWYRDTQRDIECPRCQSEITEIVNPEQDPRYLNDTLPPSPGSRSAPNHRDVDSDPEEADIEEHTTRAPNGFFMHRVYRSPSVPLGGRDEGGAPRPTDPSDGDAILRRFTDMLMNDFNVGTPGRSGPTHLYPPDPPTEFLPPPRFHRTTIRSPGTNGSHTTFTISTGTFPRGNPGGQGAAPPDFNTVFGNLMNHIPPPNPADANDPGRAGDAGGAGGPQQQRPPVFAASLHDILAVLLNPAGAVHGDAVYSQEALDRIITTLMESNPQSNAPPPASQGAIEKLERKKLDEKMLGFDSNKAECTICIDEINKGDEVLVLPCKHWFHGECVIMWLKEHNTCPVCRTPIEGGGARRGQQEQQQGQPGQQGQPPTLSPRTDTAGPSAGPDPSTSTSSRPRTERYRSPRENEQRLNAIQNLAGSSYGATTHSGTTYSGNGYRTSLRSSRQRRSSMSPTGSRANSGSEDSSRSRFRSPPSREGSDRERNRPADRDAHMSGFAGDSYTYDRSRYNNSGASRQQGEGSGSNDIQGQGNNHGGSLGASIHWFRDQFSRGAGGGGSGGPGSGSRP